MTSTADIAALKQSIKSTYPVFTGGKATAKAVAALKSLSAKWRNALVSLQTDLTSVESTLDGVITKLDALASEVAAELAGKDAIIAQLVAAGTSGTTGSLALSVVPSIDANGGRFDANWTWDGTEPSGGWLWGRSGGDPAHPTWSTILPAGTRGSDLTYMTTDTDVTVTLSGQPGNTPQVSGVYHTPAVVTPPVGPYNGKFHISGKTILDPNGAVFLPKGINLGGPHEGGSADGQTTAGSWNYFTDWRLNLARICNSPWGAGQDQNSDLNAIVNGFTSRNIVCMVDIHTVNGGNTGRYLDGTLQQVGDWWVAFAQQWKDNPYVWFNLYNEPGSDQNPVSSKWMTEAEYLIQRIRAVATNIIVCDGAMWGQDSGYNPTVDQSRSAILTYGPTLTSRYPDLLFDFHVYDQWAGGYSSNAKVADFITRCQNANLAVIVGEVADLDNGVSRRTQFDAIFDVCPGKGVGIIPWHGQSTGSGDYSMLTNSRYMGDINSTSNPTNLTYQGQRMWNFTHS